MKIYQYEDMWKAMYPTSVANKAYAEAIPNNTEPDTTKCTILGHHIAKKSAVFLVSFPDSDQCAIIRNVTKDNLTTGWIRFVGLEKPLTGIFNKAVGTK